MFGLLNINKPADWTSRDVVTHVSRILGRKVKCGHAGTLDPLATGVLLLCVGKATQLVPLIHEYSKSYLGTFLLGKKSPTDDIEGELEDVPIPESLDAQVLNRLLPEFMGEITQVPPAHSAIWINGERAYKVARRGETFEIPPRQVQIDHLELTHCDQQSMKLSLTCGTGTYVRSLGRDLARKAGTEAVMSQLVRTSIGPFSISDALPLDLLNKDNLADCLLSPLVALSHLTQVTLSPENEQKLRWGQRIPFESCSLASQPAQQPVGHPAERDTVNGPVVIKNSDEQLVAIAQLENSLLLPQIVFPQIGSRETSS